MRKLNKTVTCCFLADFVIFEKGTLLEKIEGYYDNEKKDMLAEKINEMIG
ncbi:MAG: hypothetical protein WCF93_01330 [Candidatus Moraniibacteriota bacterium]